MSIILRDDGVPFAGFSEARAARDALIESTGFAHVVVEQQGGGFAVERIVEPSSCVDQRTAQADIIIHPALRAYWVQFALMAVGGVLVFVPDAAPAVGWSGAGLGVVSFLRIWLSVHSRTYTVGERAVKARVGIISRDSITVEYRYMRSVGLHQTILGRVFNIGDVEITTAGTSGVDVVFEDVADPSAVQQVIQHRNNDSVRSEGSAS